MSDSRFDGNKTAPASRTLLSRDEVIELLLEVARKAYYALEDSEERDDGSLVPTDNAAELQAALDALEGLPAAAGYASCGPNNAKYALRSFEAQAADAQLEVAEVWDKKVTPRSEKLAHLGRRVVCSALRDGHGTIICGPRHWDSLCRGTSKDGWQQGFVDQHGAFMSRDEAWKVAEAAGQIIRRVGGDGEQLFSENLY